MIGQGNSGVREPHHLPQIIYGPGPAVIACYRPYVQEFGFNLPSQEHKTPHGQQQLPPSLPFHKISLLKGSRLTGTPVTPLLIILLD
jgi:hypothetical protein